MPLRSTLLGVVTALVVTAGIQAQNPAFARTDVTDTPDHLQIAPSLKTDANETDFVVGDFDQDGDIDVVIGRKTPFTTGQAPLANVLLINNGIGHLVDMSATLSQFASNIDRSREIKAGDMDNDGWVDLVTFNTEDDPTLIWPNLGNDAQGVWQGFGAPISMANDVGQTFKFCGGAILDYDLDGWLDLYRVDYQTNHESDLLRQDSSNPGSFIDMTSTILSVPGGPDCINTSFGTRAQAVDPATGAPLDINADTFVDLVLSENGSSHALYSDGLGGWRAGQFILGSATYDICATDFDGDGRVDILKVQDGTDSWAPNLSTNVDGTIVEGTAEVLGFGQSVDSGGFGANPNVCDWDNDGDMDLFIAPIDVDIPNCSSRRLILWENKGAGVSPRFQAYTENGQNPMPQAVYDTAVADFDGDGILDVLMSGCNPEPGFTYLVSDPNASLDGFKAEFIPDGIGGKDFVVSNVPTFNDDFRTLYNLFDLDAAGELGSGPFFGLGANVIAQVGSGPPFAQVLDPGTDSFQVNIPAGVVSLFPVVRTRSFAVHFPTNAVEMTELIEEN